MTDCNSAKHRVVWFDIPVAGLDRATAFYRAVRGIDDAVARVQQQGGRVREPMHPIGSHGFRAIVKDSEGNRIALHSSVDR